MKDNKWARLLAYVTGLVNQQLLLQNEYLAAENRILRAHLPTRLRLSDPQRSTLAEIGKRLGRKALKQVACVAKPAYDQKTRRIYHGQHRYLTLIEFRPRAGPTFRGLGDCPELQAQTRTEAGTPH